MKPQRSYERIITRGSFFLVLLIAVNTLFMVCYKYQDKIAIKKIEENKSKKIIEIILGNNDIGIVGKPKTVSVNYGHQTERLTVLNIIDSTLLCEKPSNEFYKVEKIDYYILQEKTLLQLIINNIN